MKNIFYFLTISLFTIYCNTSFSQTTIYNQTFGTPPTSGFPTGWSSTGGATGWTMSTTYLSTGYTNASAGYNVKGGSVTATLNFSSISTVGFYNINIIWGARKPNGSATLPVFQWSSDSVTWNAITYANTTTGNTWQLVNGGVSINLPAGASGVSALRLRWTLVSSGATANPYRIDDIVIKGTPLSSTPPSKLVILSVNNGITADSCHNFNVIVQTEDTSNIPSNVLVPTPITLSKLSGTGSGYLISTTDTIQPGNHLDTISVAYSNSENGVSILASSSILTSDTSNIFNVKACIAKLPTCFSWDTSGGVTNTYPGGWFPYGLGVYTTGHFAPNSGNFNTQGDSLVIHYDTIAGSVNFWLRGNNLAGSYKFDVYESDSGYNYTLLSRDTIIGNPWSLHVDTPLSTSRYIKFVYTQKTVENIAIDDVCIFLPASQPARLRILSVNNGANPDSCSSFNVVVQSQDSTGAPSNVSANLPVFLSKVSGSGTGLLIGGTGNIIPNSNIDTIQVNYSNVETGVSIEATASTMIPDTSHIFNVLQCISLVPAALPTCYEWQHSGSNIIPPPAGWYNYGAIYSAATGYSQPFCGAFDTQGDSILVFFNNSPDSVVFWLRANALVGAYVFDVKEAGLNHSYTNLASFNSTNPINNTWTHHSLPMSLSSRYLKFVYTTKFTGNVLIDSVCIYQHIFPPVATKLKITSVNGGLFVDSCHVFNVVVESQDNSNNPTNVLADTKVNLSVFNGNSIYLGGTLSDTIHAGSNTLTLPVSYSSISLNISLIASRISGDNLLSDTTSFEVWPCFMGTGNNPVENGIEAFPNPCHDFLYLKGINDVKIMRITNIFGQVVKVVSFERSLDRIPVSNLENGIYLLNFETRNGLTKRLVIVKQ